MRPPICDYCNRENSDGNVHCELVSFALTEEEKVFNARMTENHMVGHKKGLEWFCQDCIALARKYAHLTLAEATKQIHRDMRDKT